ncbi:cation:proton antiporter [Hallella bergensis]|uniref:cation:proton antiporter domain-containing protein n=1 Tax=Hallella bergensis TaxID=242750 RepID=UPI0039908587
MAQLPDLIKDLALILVVAGTVTLIFKKLRQPLVLGYLVAGFLVSPHMPYTMHVMDESAIRTWADIGVMFLLFSLGLDFSFKKILKMGMSPIIAAMSIIFSMSLLGVGVGHAFHWSRMDSLFLGGMLAMSSTTIIYKAFDEMGLRPQRFAGLVMSVLILEDILAIVMMIMLSSLANGQNPDGEQMLASVLRIGFFLILWFVVGLFIVPSLLRNTRKLMTDETMVIVSIGLCCLMAWISTTVGFSPAFGSFIMGSILAETIEADKIIRLVEPVKNLFGAIFFVSVGMLVDPKIIVEHALPIIILVATVLLGQGIFGSAGFMLSGQPLKTAMRCGFSMAQIGEFAFIIASLGLSLGVISDFLYPVVVAVSVITTFLTPYMIRFAEPCYNSLERHLPKRWIRRLDHLGSAQVTTPQEQSNWKKLLRKIIVSTLIYTILCTAVTTLMLTFFLPFIRSILPHWWANAVCGVATLAVLAPLMRSLIMKHNHGQEFKVLWIENRLNRLPLIFTILVRIVIVAALLFYICNLLTHFASAVVITLALVIIVIMILSRKLKHRAIRLERMFVKNLQSRDIEAQVHGRRRPLYEGRLLDRSIHISDFEVPPDSAWAGKRLNQLRLSNRFGVHVSSILRGRQRMNIPYGETILFPDDRLQAIGNDEQLHQFGKALKEELVPEDEHIEEREMKLQKLILTDRCPFVGKTLKESGIRSRFNCMVVGIEEGQANLTMINPLHVFKKGDIIWVVGEKASLLQLAQAN